jgi:hypothetical protein
MCSHNWEAFNYLQERVHDGRIPEPARSTLHEIISLIRMQIYVKQVLHIWCIDVYYTSLKYNLVFTAV